MRAEDLGAVLAVLEAREFVPGIPRQRQQKSHAVGRVAVELVVGCGSGKDGQPWRFREEGDALRVEPAGEQRERTDFGMPPGEPHRLVHAAASPGGADARLVHARLGEEELVGLVDVARPLLRDDALGVLRRQCVGAIAAALAEPSIVDRERVNARGCELRRQRLPRLPRRVAHVQQEHRGAGLRGRVIGGLQWRAVCRRQRDVASWRSSLREWWGSSRQNEDEKDLGDRHRALSYTCQQYHNVPGQSRNCDESRVSDSPSRPPGPSAGRPRAPSARYRSSVRTPSTASAAGSRCRPSACPRAARG